MTPSPDDARRLLCQLGEHVRALVIGARGIDMAVVEGETAADTIYAIDKVADDALLRWFEIHWPDVEVVSEGLDEAVVVGSDPEWTVIVDTIDGKSGRLSAGGADAASDVIKATATAAKIVKRVRSRPYISSIEKIVAPRWSVPHRTKVGRLL